MKNLPYWLSLALCGWASHAFAQNEVDALRYSETQFGGSARTLGIGGANTAVGADIGNISSNPAGLGLFQQSEIDLTLGYATDNSNGRYNGTGSKFGDTRNSLQVGGFGIVFANRRPDSDNSSDWRAGTFAIGMARVNDFNRNFRYTGNTNDQQSLFQRLREPQVSNQNIDDQYKNGYTNLDGIAYGSYLTNLNNVGTETVPRPNTTIRQQERVTSTGGQSQYTFAYGASYRDKLYLGGGIGVVNTRFDQTRDFVEADANNAVSLDLYDRLQTRGTGFNLRVGGIYRATDYVRLGASVQSPTWSRLTDTYSTQLNTTFTPPVELVDNNGNVQSIPSGAADIPTSNYSYSVTTPFRANGGVAVLLGKYGFLSGDLEYVNYNQARLSSNSSSSESYSFANENQNVRDLYQSALNLKLGAEARYALFRARLGYAHYGDPYKTNDFDRSQSYYTAGLGLRQSSFFLDVAGVYNTSNRYYSPYVLNDGSQPVISVDANRFTASVTAGVTF